MPPTPSPTYERLRDYIAKRMRMSHVCQPLMLKERLGRRDLVLAPAWGWLGPLPHKFHPRYRRCSQPPLSQSSLQCSWSC
jgi:hypothetical protein